jgi:murein tripeptide amidase MpaA
VSSVTAHQNAGQDDDIDYFYLAQEDLAAKYKALVSVEGGIAEDVITFSGSHIEDVGDYGRAWVGSISATELQRLHKNYNDQLFAGNIRLFLGDRKGGINEQIISTAKETPGSFWALNNGITIVADTVTPRAQTQSGY